MPYSEKFEQAEWVAYRLNAKQQFRSKFQRIFFIRYKNVVTQSAVWKNYKKLAFDKEHLCPAGDIKFSKAAFEATFYTSNI